MRIDLTQHPFPRFAAAIAVVLSLAGASPAAGAGLSDRDRADVARVEAYLNGLESLRSDFIQVSSGGRFAEGTFYLERPSRMRLDYRQPPNLQVYATGNFLIQVDTELETASHIPIGSTLAGFLVRDRIRLSGDIGVRQVDRARGTLSLELYRTEEPEAGSFTVTFTDSPLTLRKWSVTDAQGVQTHVTLVGPTFDTDIPDEVFEYDQERFERWME